MRLPLLLGGALLLSLPLAAQTTPAPARAEPIYTYVEQMPVPAGGLAIALQHIQNHLRYSAEAQRLGVQGKVFVKFVVDAAGKVQQPTVLKGLGAGCDEEALRLIRELADWTPGKQNGQTVSVYYTLPVAFTLPDNAAPVAAGAPSTADRVYTYAEQMPQPPGGIQGLIQYLGQTIRYPDEAVQQRLEGKVFVNFVVDSQGRIQDAKVTKGVHPLLDAEALRVISQLPAWTPGRQEGQPVNVSYTLPLTFELPAAPKYPHDVPAEYPGGMDAMRRDLRTALRKAHIKAEGRVFVQFVVDATGQVQEPKLLKSLGPDLDAGILRAVQTLRTWKPAQYQGRPVPVAFTIPVDFGPAGQ
ncbi:energy transducer TonB [Hymenobacter gummosus]|uniref:Energy transducer TonB n=1 Tax=Hymenobacter gummosus TaxID=1776032 RepID=A0A3S0JKF6_9BACT|nr:energy transducer TonB [Hymenobacter gummosus]RTQ53368.1 energy transducer TonB [Hymenobacter gummosus]